MSTTIVDQQPPSVRGPAVLRAAVVDDDAVTRSLAARVLELAGLEAATYPSADAAWQELSRADSPVDVVVTDAEMPGSLDGLRLVEQLDAVRRGVRVVVMSSSSEALGAALALAGVVGVLQKPFLPCRLVELVLA